MGAFGKRHAGGPAGLALLALLLLVGTVAGAADEAAPPAAAPTAAAVPAAEAPVAAASAPVAVEPAAFPGYIVRLGDEIHMSVWGEPTLAGEAAVMPDGTVSLPLIGSMAVAGKTVPVIAGEVQQAYRRYLKDPKIALSCVPKNPEQVYLGGSVAKPGPVNYDPRLRLYDYLGLAGGPTVGADLARVVITSVQGAQTSTAVLDLSSAAPAQQSSLNPLLRPGDTVWVGKALPISVVGAVQRPGSFDYQPGLRLSDYVGMAGGPTDRSTMRKVSLKRAGQPTVASINLSKALEKPDSPELNPTLAPGDVVTVPTQFVGGTLGWTDILHTLTVGLIAWSRTP